MAPFLHKETSFQREMAPFQREETSFQLLSSAPFTYFHLHLTTLSPITPITFTIHNQPILSLGLPPQTPNAKGIYYKNQKFCGIYAVDLSKGNLRNPFGVRRAPSEPASVYSVVKKSHVNSHFTKHPQSAALIAIFYHLSQMETVSRAIFEEFNEVICSTMVAHEGRGATIPLAYSLKFPRLPRPPCNAELRRRRADQT